MEELQQLDHEIEAPKQPFHQKHSGLIIAFLVLGLAVVAYFAFFRKPATQGMGKLLKTDTIEALYITQAYGVGNMTATLQDHYENGIQYRVPYRVPILDSLGRPKLDSLQHPLQKDTLLTLSSKYVFPLPISTH